ncbi:MAG: carboxypeptidase-like regulatory domain-containing protein [Desulfobulbaceae bacterium]|nr:carboxypeptidase-like regulatory domain-containing protein [Desulfobulbaceae bacterium]
MEKSAPSHWFLIERRKMRQDQIMRTGIVVIHLLLIGFCYIKTGWAAEEYESENMKEVRQILKDMLVTLEENHEKQEPITGYGRVLDQKGDPVSGADVKVQWDYYDPDQSFKIIVLDRWVTTDANGNFTFTVEKAHEPTIREVKAKGYDLLWDETPYYQLVPDEKNIMIANSNNEPVIIYMRKLNPTTFLLKSETGYYFKEPNTILRYTMIPGLMFKDDHDLSKMKKPEQNDLVFTVNNNEDGSYTMHIGPIPGIGGAMQMLDEYLYEAPADGYEPAASLTIRPEDGKLTKYLYFTSRKTPVYSRMTMELGIDDYGNELRFHCTTWTNPYGKRNLEWEPELPFDLFIKLRDEAEEALNNGTLPPEPEDLQALIEQYK